jgi:hypothetical protein
MSLIGTTLAAVAGAPLISDRSLCFRREGHSDKVHLSDVFYRSSACTCFDKMGDAITIIDAVSGQIRTKLVKTAPGNAEKLAP